MHLVYIDDTRESPYYGFSALAIPEQDWADVFAEIKLWRRELRDNYGIPVYRELHATELVGGRGNLSTQTITKSLRAGIFKQGLALLARQQNVRVFNSFRQGQEQWAFERLLNRINRTLSRWDSRAILFCDEGKEAHYTKLVRRMSVHNPIPSRFGVWSDGSFTQNIPIDRILEDPVFKKSDKSYFIQLVDFCAYALLRKERPMPSKKRYGIEKAFDLLKPICTKVCNPRDEYGIIR